MTDLILHIGLPKTGTTTLQEKYFCKLPNYLGRSMVMNLNPGNNHEIQELYKIVGIRGKTTNGNSVINWAEHILALKKSMNPELSYLFLSDEELAPYSCKYNRKSMPIRHGMGRNGKEVEKIKDLPIIRFLDDFSKNVWQEGSVKVILTLRNQPEWLASLYCQLSDRIPNASQRNFEQQVNRIIIRNDPYINWYEWIINLQNILGKRNVLVLLLEEISNPLYLNQITEFIGVSFDETCGLIKKFNLNERKTKNNTWCIRPLKKRILEEIAISYWGFGRAKNLSNIGLKVAKRVGLVCDPVFHNVALKSRDKEIVLTEETRSRILQHVKPFNKKLFNYLGRDIESLGY